ncbi:alanyl-tRNA editing protein [Propylenella binzhouense]|uniref:Alanine--tRNA ligase n=1 Tax=Propylenella binzhouense TaxID=2555902 RepID=A0A964T6N0_9HYPH|nr:alanyl-tRNA editing protein [Propylenella binzhouense]MYZ49468.1 alanyl-tRNA editing protein [Propylenella binzhouense]
MRTATLFRDDAYLRACEAQVVEVGPEGIVLDRTVFYPAAGGQPGDSGTLAAVSAGPIAIGATVYAADGAAILHVPAGGAADLAAGMAVTAGLDWERRSRHMRMHSALHLLCSLIPYPVTGGSVGAEEGRLDFDIPDAGAVDRDALAEALNALVAADHPIATRWITDEELAGNPGLVRTMKVKPPTGSGRVRLVAIGADGAVDLQPCGGTHVRATGEIGPLAVTKIEKKGRQNRRVRIRFAEPA